MTVNRARLNTGVFFVVLGAVPLAVEAGLIDRSLAGQLVGLWPIVLIALGVGLMLRFGPAQLVGGLVVAATFGLVGGALIAGGGHGLAGTCAGNPNPADPSITRNGEFATSGQVNLELSCVELTLDRQAGTAWQVQAQQGGGYTPTIEQSGDRLGLGTGEGPFIGLQRRAWHVTLPQTGLDTVYLTTNASNATVGLGGGPLTLFGGTFNASDAHLDLASADMSHGPLNLTLNASSGTLLMPVAGTGAASSITLNASSLKLCIAPQLALRIGYDSTLSSDNFAAAGLERVGDGWQTPGYGGATARMEMHLSANVSSTTLDRSGGCQ